MSDMQLEFWQVDIARAITTEARSTSRFVLTMKTMSCVPMNISSARLLMTANSTDAVPRLPRTNPHRPLANPCSRSPRAAPHRVAIGRGSG
ncbi:hypothetical protein Maq22A_c10345 [Methylobacterium aquaticum]|uniref:Uncharacterized protein n=1 Tax=Methylobacterium aquaticum TaxID=270351 RepID=A0A0C6FAA8_9HYPH|nr:hypothetical protein Maq22A_c10345 [Methylobacterium aquaticum]